MYSGFMVKMRVNFGSFGLFYKIIRFFIFVTFSIYSGTFQMKSEVCKFETF